ncbi:MAG TPA: hypothetical protein PLY82_00575 [Methanosarcina thermophila]|jgi:hypothetical protein|uniref:Uncharacterized protein n=1 Tax=Methanosarcina thermophila TaxID=2210 RepID=A0A3G9CR08_METTE|nr:hypothetical protein [Methanosarcina thermophila]BAW28224.1 conserved hypothetical protein [Methanosarcina thermophila]HOQ64438.1 hypothetical protein [Methanosarcina thermophila]HPT79668.1 hypothetical protein [Methanosarcina thermophila]
MNQLSSSLGNYYRYFIGLDGIILTFLIIESYPVVVNLATKASFLIMLVGGFCVLVDNWNRKSIDYRLYVELYENEYQAESDYKAGKIFINLIFYVVSLYLVVSGIYGAL